jgi:hypothetical protein
MRKLGRIYDNYVIFVIIIKILFVIFAVISKHYQNKIKNAGNNNSEIQEYTQKYNWALYWKDRLEFFFLISTSIICIIIFYPFYSDPIFIDRHTKILLFVYGFIVLITLNWNILGTPPPWFIYLQNIVGKK